jgi:hypothetical protein
MKIEIKIEKEGMDEKEMPEEMDEELTPEQIAAMAKKLKSNSVLSRAERTMLAAYLLQEEED